MRILVATGASGGHIFPALSFLSSLKEKNSGIEGLLVLPLRSSGIKFQTADFKVRYISMPKLALAINIKNSLVLFKFIQAWVESFFILLSFKPDVVVGFGTIDSLPLVMLAWFLRVKTLIHEQNVIPGRANKLLAKFSDAIAVSFAKTKDYLRVDIAKISVTGNPLRRELKRIDRDEAWEFFGFEPGKFTLLVMGGSQGSH
ncbi:MAG: glycosyltransferase, partial [Candidatus Omnitrophica bacterium]|nr:glycosyltransferase [Candidatus Omnitrophota bacterium]